MLVVQQVTIEQVHPLLCALRERGITQADFALSVDFSPFYLSRVIRGHHPGGRKFRAACARALGVPIETLFHHENATPEQAA